MNFSPSYPFPFANFGFLVALISLSTIVVHLAFAVGIYTNAEGLTRSGKEPFFVNSKVWALATALWGLPVVALYWLMHYSSLNRPAPRNDF